MSEERLVKLERANQRLTTRMRKEKKEMKTLREVISLNMMTIEQELQSSRYFNKILAVAVLAAVAFVVLTK